MGSLDYPFNPLSIAIGAEASFVARAIDTDKKGLTEVLSAAARHRGSAFVEILQNCNIYNDNAFDFVREEKGNRIYLEDGAPIRFGLDGEKGVVQDGDGSARVVDVGEPATTRFSSTTPRSANRASPSRSRASPTRPTARCRSASSRASSGPSTTT